jgi:HNH endonuclease
MLTQEYLKSILHYCPETGVFTWKVNRSRNYVIGKVAGCNHNMGYRTIKVQGEPYLAHRLAWLYVHGRFPKETDHINCNRSDNRLCNLREVTRSENCHNASLRKDSTTKIKGVRFIARNKKWQGQIRVNGDTISKVFPTINEAENWVTCQRAQLHGEFANHG